MSKTSPHKSWEAQQNKKAISLLELVIKKIKAGKVQVVNQGWWDARHGNSITARIDVKMKDETVLDDFPENQ